MDKIGKFHKLHWYLIDQTTHGNPWLEAKRIEYILE